MTPRKKDPREMRLRGATPADAPMLRHWDEQPHMIASGLNDDWGWETELGLTHDWREQLIAEVDGCAIGFIQTIDPAREETRYWGDVPANLRAVDIWIGEAAYLGKGYGSKMMQLALARCLANPALCNTDPFAEFTLERSEGLRMTSVFFIVAPGGNTSATLW